MNFNFIKPKKMFAGMFMNIIIFDWFATVLNVLSNILYACTVQPIQSSSYTNMDGLISLANKRKMHITLLTRLIVNDKQNGLYYFFPDFFYWCYKLMASIRGTISIVSSAYHIEKHWSQGYLLNQLSTLGLLTRY